MRFVVFFIITRLLCFVLAQTADEYKITSLPGINIEELNFTQYSGHIELNRSTNSNIFFWMIEREIKSTPEKLIIWLNGGPGCSSMDGLFLENGPYRVNENLTLSYNKYGWQKYATMVYVDQPVGTGFSIANTNSYVHNMSEATTEFMLFLDKLYSLFPHLQTHELYIAGESYAGTYIPYFTSEILKLNRENVTSYQLKGNIIGNGWISPKHQYDSMYDFAESRNLLNQTQLSAMSQQVQNCRNKLAEKEYIQVSVCEELDSFILDNTITVNEQGEQQCMNVYDIRLRNEPYPDCGLTWPHILGSVTEYLRLSEVKSAIHAEKQDVGWRECDTQVYRAIHHDTSKPSFNLLPDILKEIPVLLYSGEYDLICNYVGTLYLIGNMTWGGSTGFSKSTKQMEWTIKGKEVGYHIEERNLTFAFIKDGSHMVPYDRPIESLDMINNFIKVSSNEISSRKNQEEEGQHSLPKGVDTDVITNHHWGIVSLVIVIIFILIAGGCWYHQSSPLTKQKGFRIFRNRRRSNEYSTAL